MASVIFSARELFHVSCSCLALARARIRTIRGAFTTIEKFEIQIVFIFMTLKKRRNYIGWIKVIVQD